MASPIFNFYYQIDAERLEAQLSAINEKLAELRETIHAEKEQVASILSTLEQLKADYEADKLDKAATVAGLESAIEAVKGIAPDAVEEPPTEEIPAPAE